MNYKDNKIWNKLINSKKRFTYNNQLDQLTRD